MSLLLSSSAAPATEGPGRTTPRRATTPRYPTNTSSCFQYKTQIQVQILIFSALSKRLRSHKNILVQEQRYKQYLIRNLMKISVPFIWCKKSASVRHYCHCIAGRLSCSNGYRQCLFATEGTEFFCVLSIYHRD